MINFIVVGKCRRVTSAVLQAIRSFTDAKCAVIGGPATAVLRWSTLCKQQLTLALDGADDDAFVAAVNDIVARRPHVVLIPADCDAIRLTNRVRERLAVRITPIPEPETLDMLDDKWQFHQFCTRHGLAVPETRHFESKFALNYDDLVAEFGTPFVVKPLNQAGSTGVRVVVDRDDFDANIRRDPGYDFGALIVQRYIDGPDVDISVLSLGGTMSAFAIQQVDESDARIRFVDNPALEEMASALCRASRFHGVMHIDARVESATGKTYLIESNPRFWASLTASVWCGLNFVAESLLQAPSSIGVRRLTEGTAFTRHPLVRPSAWGPMIGDHGARGRLLRALAFDPPALGAFALTIPGMAWRRTGGYLKGATGNSAASEFAKETA